MTVEKAKTGASLFQARQWLMLRVSAEEKQRETEQPTREQVDDLVDIFLERMGLTEHQTVYALHHNTEHFHVCLTAEDLSRVDAMIAVRLRATGHSQAAIAEALFQCDPTIRQGDPKRETRNWHRYAERTAAYAFGVVGDVALVKNERLLEHWKKVEGLAIVPQYGQCLRC